MKYRLIAVGAAKSGPETALFRHYAERLKTKLDLVEITLRKKMAGETAIAAEAAAIEARLLGEGKRDRALILLDEGGLDLTSRDFTKRLEAFALAGKIAVDFVIGGTDGLGESLFRRADLVIAFGRITWPHLLVRALLAEQLYRAETIRAGHPYHRD